MRRFLKSNKFIPILIAGLTILAYGLFIPYTGFYWDDWVFAWIAKFLGPKEFLPAFIHIRPFLIPIFYVTTSLIPPVPLYWQIFALVIRCLAGLSLWSFLNQVWPRHNRQTLVASLLFIVFPAYSQHWVAYTHINQEWIAFILYLLSCGLTASAVRNPNKFKVHTVCALALLIEGLFATEYFFGMEPLRLFFIWVILAEETANRKEVIIKAFKVWLPYLSIWILNGIWLAFYYSLGYNAYDMEVLNKPFTPASILIALGEAIWKVGLFSWVQVLVLTAKAFTAPSAVITYLIVALTFIILLPIIKNYAESPSFSNTIHIQFILIGFVGIILGRVPSYAAGLPLRLQSSFDRFTISMMVGGCLFIVGLVEWLIKNPRGKIHVWVLLIALGTGQQFFNGNIFRRDWERQQDIFWQLKWRIPSLAPNTVILTDEIEIDSESDISLVGPINWMYAPDYKRSNLPYLLLYSNSRLGGTLPALEPDKDIQFALRTVTFYGNTSQAVVILMPQNGCLRVLDPKLGDIETYNKKLKNARDLIHLSDTTFIHAKELAAPGFLSKPKITWCYYYTKAELARQLKNWDQILILQQEAASKGYSPTDSLEWLPFIEANAMTSHFDEAQQLSMDAIRKDARTRIGICKVWERVQAQGPVKNDTHMRTAGALYELQCKQ